VSFRYPGPSGFVSSACRLGEHETCQNRKIIRCSCPCHLVTGHGPGKAGLTMTQVGSYHSSSREDHPVYHRHTNCPAGERVIEDGNAMAGQGVERDPCKFCQKKDDTGRF